MRNLLIITLLFIVKLGYAQESLQDTSKIYKKRVLETTEVDFLTSYFKQDGNNAAVTGGIGTEKLTDFTSTFIVSIPLSDDDVLTIDAGISAYTSASSSNLDPFAGYDDDDDDNGNNNSANAFSITAGSPWVQS